MLTAGRGDEGLITAFPTLTDMLSEHARSRPNEPSVVCGRRRLSYAELDERVQRLSSALSAEGVTAGSTVLWFGRNCHRVLETLLACSALGAVMCPANWRISPAELEFVLRDASPKLVIWEEGLAGVVESVRGALADADAIHWVRQDDRAESDEYEELLRGTERPFQPAPSVGSDAPVLLVYTAAFDGNPNGALLSHSGLISHNSVMERVHWITHETVCLQCAPLFHIGGLYHLLTTFQAGGCNVFVPQAEPEDVCEAVQNERCTTAYLVQPMIDRILGWDGHARYDLTSLRTRSFGAAWDALVTPDQSPRGKVPDAFGQTELCGLVTLTCLGGTGRHGRPIPGAQVRIVDPEGRDVTPGDCGEIVVRGPTVMVGYLNRADANADRFRDGWYHTNDLGVREADGSITWTGSKSRLIKSGMENIYPQQVEACLREHPAVADCAVIGIPDDVYEQAVRAVVVVTSGSDVTERDLVEHCRARLATYKKPRSVVFVESLPRVNGRLDYDTIDRDHGGGGYPGSAVGLKST